MATTRTKQILCWKNRFSGEEGFVKTVSRKKGYFEATKDKSDAKAYVNVGFVNKDMQFLDEIGETKNNEFFCMNA